MSDSALVAVFDDRSANTARTSGWERYSRNLLDALGGRVQPLGITAPTFRRRLRTDWTTLPAARRAGAVGGLPLHLPTFPPTPVLRRRLVWTVHDLTWWLHRGTASAAGRAYYRPLAELAMRRPDITWLTPSHQVRRELLERFGLAPDAVIAAPLGVSPLPDVEAFRADRPYLLSVATLEPRKNLGFLLEAYSRSRLRRTHDLRLVGRRAWGARVPADVIVMDAVDDRTLAALYRGADALVSPSIYEGFGLPLVEALSVGVAVLCSDIPVHHEVAGPMGRYFSLDAVDDLVGLLDGLTADTEAVRQQRRQWACRYTWTSCADLTLTAYERASAL